MKVALITTPASLRSGIGDYTRHLLPFLREECDLHLFTRRGEEEAPPGQESRPIADLDARHFDQVLYQLGNETHHAFMVPMVRAIGGTVVLHDWVLFDLALAARPDLARGGLRAARLLLREGGMAELRRWWRNRRARPVERDADRAAASGAALVEGWHGPEAGGRWTSQTALFRLPGRGVRRARLELIGEPGRSASLLHRGSRLGSRDFTEEEREIELEVELPAPDRPLLALESSAARRTGEQRRSGDRRRLGVFVRSIRYWDAAGEHAIDLHGPVVAAPRLRDPAGLRFELSLNRSIVRLADAFLVHSEHVRQLILTSRNQPTPIGVVPHGGENRWREEDRGPERGRLGLSGPWRDGFLIASFGKVQAHKRLDVLLKALVRARRERPDLHLALVGSLEPEHFDARSLVRRLKLEDSVRLEDWVPQETAWSWLHAADLAVQLRGPSTGGASGGVHQALSLGRGVIASDGPEQAGLPEDCVVKVPRGVDEVSELARLLVELRDDPGRRAGMEAAARRYVDEVCHWRHVARMYVEHMNRFPRARGSRGSVVSVALRRIRRGGRD